jgi:hypothetical protein
MALRFFFLYRKARLQKVMVWIGPFDCGVAEHGVCRSRG